MGLFGRKKKNDYPVFPEGDLEPVLRCSICTGEQVLCARDRQTGELHELMLIKRPDDLAGFCEANGLREADVRRIY